MSDRIAPQAYMGGNLLSGDIFQMLGLPSPGGFTTPLQTITDSVLGPGTYQNFQNAGTKKLLDVALKGVVGGKHPQQRRGRPRKAPVPKVCRHKYPNRCKCPKVEGAGIFDNVKDLFKAWEPDKIASKVGDLVIGNVVKKALGGSAIAARVNGFVSDPQVQKDIHKLFANAMTDMLVKHEQAGGAIPLDHPIMMELGPAISGSGRRRIAAGSWTKWLNPLYLAKRALHATHIDRIINKIPVVGNVAAATGITGGSLVPFIPQNPRGLRVLIAKLRDMPDTLAHFEMTPFDLDFLETHIHPRMDPSLIETMYKDLYPKYEFGSRSNAVAVAAGRPRGRPRKHPRKGGVAPPTEDRAEEGSVAAPMTKKERQAKYRAANREKLREKQRQYREAKKVKVI